MKGHIANHQTTFRNIYAPNEQQIPWSGVTILGCDINGVLEPLLDTSSEKSAIDYKALAKLNLQYYNIILQSATVVYLGNLTFHRERFLTLFCSIP